MSSGSWKAFAAACALGGSLVLSHAALAQPNTLLVGHQISVETGSFDVTETGAFRTTIPLQGVGAQGRLSIDLDAFFETKAIFDTGFRCLVYTRGGDGGALALSMGTPPRCHFTRLSLASSLTNSFDVTVGCSDTVFLARTFSSEFLLSDSQLRIVAEHIDPSTGLSAAFDLSGSPLRGRDIYSEEWNEDVALYGCTELTIEVAPLGGVEVLVAEFNIIAYEDF